MRRIISFRRVTALVSIFILALITFAFRSDPSFSGTRQVFAAMAAAVTATMTGTIINDDGDGKIDPTSGTETTEKTKYTATITNNGTDPATGVVFNVPLDPHTTLVPGSLKAGPVAVDDTYTALGNVQISQDVNAGLLVNDFSPLTGVGFYNLSATAESKKSSNCSACAANNVTISADGSFTYNPPPGFEGSDTFTYTVTDANNATSTGTATITVSGMIWFVNAAAANGGNGTLAAPFNCLVGAGCYNASANDPGDNVFIYSGNYTAGLTLKNNQRIIGQGANASLSTITGLTPPTGSMALPSPFGSNPILTTGAAATSAITLAQNNTLRGFTIGNTTAADVAGINFGTLNASNITLNGTGRALDLNNGTISAVFQSIESTSSGTQGIALQTVAGTLTSTFGTTISGSTTQGILVTASTANIDFGNTTVSAGTDGVSLQNNSAGTRSFGTLSITDGTGVGFLHANGGGLTSFSGKTTITNPGGRCIDIQNAASSNGVTFRDVNATQCGGTGVNLQNNAGAITFADLDISPDAAQRPLQAAGNTGAITNTSGSIPDSGAVAIEIAGTSSSRTPLAMVFDTVSTTGAANGIVLNNTSGTFAVNGSGTTSGSGGLLKDITNRGASFINADGITLKNMNFTNVGTVNGDDPTNVNSTCGALDVDLGGNAGCNAGIHLDNVTGATFDRLSLNGGIQEGINGNKVTSFNLSNSSVTNFGNQVRENGIQLRNLTGTAQQPSTISNTFVTGNQASQLLVVGTAGTLSSFTISGGTFGTSTAPNGVDGITVEGTGTSNITVSVQNATLNKNASDGFFYSATDTSVVNAKIQGCTITDNVNSAVNIGIASDANGGFTIGGAGALGNTINGHNVEVGRFINVNVANPSTGTLQGTISGNNISGAPAATTAAGISIISNGSGTLTTSVTNNTISGPLGDGILVMARDGSSRINATVTGNTVTLPSGNTNNGILVQAGASSILPDSSPVCADIGGAGALSNNITNTPGINSSIRVRQRFSTVVTLPGFGGPNSNTTDVITYLNGRNNINGGTNTAAAQAPGSIQGGAACTQPVAADQFIQNNLKTTDSDKNAGLSNLSYQSTSEFLAGIQPLFKNSQTDAEITGPAIEQTEIIPVESAVKDAAAAQAESRGYLGYIAGLVNKLASIITPIAHAEEGNNGSQNLSNGEAPALFAGETVCVDGNQNNFSCATGFTLPAGKSVTITFEVTLNNPPNLSGVPPAAPKVSSQGTISGTNFGSVLTDDTTITGTADPTTTPIDLFDTTTTVQSNNSNPSQGDTVIFTATVVSNPAGNPTTVTGTVQFFDGASPIICNEGSASTQTLNASGIATCTTSALASAGSPHMIKAQYNGDGNFDPSSGTVSQTVQACTANPVVTTTNDSGAGSLRAAIVLACTAPNNNITFNLGAGAHTITLASELSVSRNVNITGPGANLLEIKGSQVAAGFRVFNIPNGITANISALTISSGGSAVGGGGVNNSGTLNLSACTVKGNQTTGGGGGIYNAGALTINACTISNNVALVVGGGGIYNAATGTLTILNSTISTNTANGGGNGGGINNASVTASAVTLKNDTIVSNFADGAGGGIFNGAVPIDIGNTIVGDNDTTSHAAKDIGGAYNSLDFNLFETIDTAVITGTTTNNKTNVDAQLGALTDNGGPTLTHALLIDSPALDAGGNTISDNAGLTTDQRGTGFARKRDAADANTTQTVDIGAFEADPTVENITNKTTAEDTPLSFTFNVGDDTTAFDSITAVSGAGDQTLVPNAGITVTGTAGTGQRTLNITPAASQNGTATITVTVTKTISGKTLSMSDTFTLTVSEVNNAPVANPDTLANVAEDSGLRTIPISSLLANDSAGAPNENTQTLTLSLVNGNAVGGTATSDAANVYFTPAADYNGIAGFQYTITDNGTTNGAADPKTSSPAAVSFTIWEVNDAPVAVNDTLTSVNEDSGQRIIPFSDLTTNDNKGAANENAQILIVKTVGGAVGGMVSINGSNVLFTPDANFNGTASFTYTIEDNGTTNGVSDPKTSAAAATVQFNVLSINDMPTLDPVNGPLTILEDANTQTVNLTGITAGAPDEISQTLSVTAVSDNPGLIPNPAISYTSPNTTGTLTYKPVANQFGTATITVTVKDNGGTVNGEIDIIQRTFIVNVTAVNDAPSFTKGANQIVNEDAGAQTVNGWATNISVGPANESGQALNFNVTNNNNALFTNPPAVDPATGTLTYTPAANANGTATVTVTLSDNGGTDNGGQDTSAPQTFTMTINVVNDAPTLDAIANPAAIAEDSAQQTVNLAGITAGPANENTQTLTVTATSDNTALIPNPTVNYASPSATGTLNYTPVANANGTAIITVTVKDNGGTDNNGADTFTRTFTVTVWEVNDAPTAVNDTLTDIVEDSGQRIIPFADLTTNDSKGPANESTQTLIVKTAGGAIGGTAVLDSANNRVLFTPAANYNGPASFTYTIEDNGTTNGVSDPKTSAAAATVSFNVLAVNDAPTLDTIISPQTVLEDADNQTVNLTGITAGPVDESTQTLTITAVSNNTALIPNPTVTYTSPSATGTLTYKSVANQNGTATITVTVTDNGGTANNGVNNFQRTFIVNVTAVNDAPSFTKGANQTVNEDAGAQTAAEWATNISAGPADESGQALNFNVTTNNNSLFSVVPAINPANGTLTYTPAANAFGTATVTVTLSDNGGTDNGGINTSAAQTFTITVNAVADTPSVTNATTNEDTQTASGLVITRNAADSSEVTHFKITNITNGTLYKHDGVTKINNNDFITVSEGTGDGTTGLKFTPAIDFSGTGSFTVQASLSGSDAGLGGGTATATITINSVNDAPTLDPILNPAPILFNASQQTVNLTGITAGGGETQTLTVTAVSNNPGLIPNPTVNYTSPNATGSLNYAPVGNQSGTAVITVTVTDNGGTANNGVNSVSRSFTVEVVALADLSVSETDSPDPVIPGNNIAYTINVSNGGPATAAAVELTNVIPANSTYQMIYAPAGWTCTTPAVNGTGTVSCTNPLLATGATDTFVLVVNVNTGTATGTIITNTTSVMATNPDPNTANNTASTTTTAAEYTSPAPTGQASKTMLVKPAAGNTTAGGGASDTACTVPAGVTTAGTFANINQALGATNAGDTIYVCPKYTAGAVVPYVEQISLGFTNLSVVGITDGKGSRAVIAANPSTATTSTTQVGTNYIVQIVATGVNFGNFVVDGAPTGTNFAGTGIFNGIAVRRSGAFVFNNTVQNIKTADADANANGQSITIFGAGSAGSPLEAGTTSSPVNILNNVVQNFRSNGINAAAGSSSAYAFVRGNYIIGNGANSGTSNQAGVQFQAGANGDVFNNRISRILDSVAGCSSAAFSNCSAGIRLNTTSSTSGSGLRIRFNQISNTQTGIFVQDVQYVSMTSNNISHSAADGINLRGSAFNLGSNFNTISQNTIFASRRAGIFIGLVGGDASLGNNLTMNTIEDAVTGVANNTPAGNNTIPVTGATANTFISVNNFTGSASSGANDVQNTNPLP